MGKNSVHFYTEFFIKFYAVIIYPQISGHAI